MSGLKIKQFYARGEQYANVFSFIAYNAFKKNVSVHSNTMNHTYKNEW
jgi:hypothetical protein